MPYTSEDAILPSEILTRVTKVVMAFVGTYAYTRESQWQTYECSSTCTFASTWPITTKGNEWAQQMKAINPNLKVEVSFGGWNQGPGDETKNCYSESGCYADVDGLANELAAYAEMEYIDGIDLDYEESTDLEGASPPGVAFLGALSQALQAKGITVSQSPQPPYFGTADTGPGGGSYVSLVNGYPDVKSDVMQIQYYNNPGFKIGTDDAGISANYWSAVSTMGGAASNVLLGLCFIDCMTGYSAYDPADPSMSSALAPSLLQTTMAGGTGFGGIMIWANQKSTYAPSSCTDGCFDQMPGWLDAMCNAVQ
jgi:hypothetical protein